MRGGVGEGVEIGFGGDNSLVNHGTITSESGTAILANVGNETIENHGRILGLTDLGSGNNVINSFGDRAANSPVIVTGNRRCRQQFRHDHRRCRSRWRNNEFNNLAGGIFNAGTAVSLGVGNSFINFGHIEPGGAGSIQTTVLWRLGLAAGYSESDISVDERRSAADVDSFHLAGYAGGAMGPLALRTGPGPGTISIPPAR